MYLSIHEEKKYKKHFFISIISKYNLLQIRNYEKENQIFGLGVYTMYNWKENSMKIHIFFMNFNYYKTLEGKNSFVNCQKGYVFYNIISPLCFFFCFPLFPFSFLHFYLIKLISNNWFFSSYNSKQYLAINIALKSTGLTTLWTILWQIKFSSPTFQIYFKSRH